MTRRIIGPLVGIVVLTAAITVAQADTALTDKAVLTQTGYSAGVGGEFTATPTAGSSIGKLGDPVGNPVPVSLSSGTFQTFCIEYTEEFYPGTQYWTIVTDNAVAGGGGASVSQNLDGLVIGYKVGNTPTAYTADDIDKKTELLYYEFRHGILPGYFTGNRQANAADLQNAIWYLEGEGGVNNAFVAYATANVNKYTDADLANAVKVMTMWTTQPVLHSSGFDDPTTTGVVESLPWIEVSGFAQDQLTLASPNNITAAPVPASSWMGLSLLAGLGLVGLIRKRMTA